MPQLYALFEHASGFAIFRTTEFEEIAVFLPQVRKSITDISKFRSIVYLISFQPFNKQKDALVNMKSIVAEELNINLQLFLENNIPRTKKSKQTVVLGVEEPLLASVISDKLGIHCSTSGVVKEIIRGIRMHFHKLIKGFKDVNLLNRTQLALAHQYSREKVNFDAKRQDCMIIESNALIDDLNKDIRILTCRIKEWYSLHFPELYKILQSDGELYILSVQMIGDRKKLPEDIKEKLNTLIRDLPKVENILYAAHNSMGMEIAPIDLQNLNMICERALSLIKKRQTTLEYLNTKMNGIAPNISSIVGESIAARLISRAGGLTKLAKLPASTVQILGADKKIFRSVKGALKPATCGLLSETAFMGKAGKSRKGHLARILANKCALAARVDCFSKKNDQNFGHKLTEAVENIIKLNKRLKGVIDKEVIQVNKEDTIIHKKKKAGKKPEEIKEKGHSVVNGDSLVAKNSIEETSKEIELICSSDVSQKEKKKVLEEIYVEPVIESNLEQDEIKMPKKKKLKANKSQITKDLEVEESEVHTNDKDEEQAFKKRKSLRIINRKAKKL